jgi:hypothetical protein
VLYRSAFLIAFFCFWERILVFIGFSFLVPWVFIIEINCLTRPLSVLSCCNVCSLELVMQSYAFTSQDYVVTDFHIVKELLMQLMHQFYKVSADSFNSRKTIATSALSSVRLTFWL